MADALEELGIASDSPVIVHGSLSSFGHVEDGAQAIVATLIDHFESLIVPTFTYKTMLVPEKGPPNNALRYGKTGYLNKMAEMYHPDFPADRMIGLIPETVRNQPQALRSRHPLLSFAGVNASDILSAQSLAEPIAPISELMRRNGWVILMGVGHTSNTSIHWAERLAGRKFFTRWALTQNAVTECANFPPCSEGFDAIEEHLAGIVRESVARNSIIKAYPLIDLIDIAIDLIRRDATALLCGNFGCMRCEAVRKDVHTQAFT